MFADVVQKTGDGKALYFKRGAVTPSPSLYNVTMTAQGSLLKVQTAYGFRNQLQTVVKRVGGLRSTVSEFSAASRRRLLHLFGTVDYDAATAHGKRVLFVTLTYASNMRDSFQAKAHLRAWFKRLQRAHGNVGFVWRIEMQRRGAIHFHLILFGARYIDKDWVAESWSQVTGERDQQGRPAFTRTVSIRSARGVMSYAAKYVAKAESAENSDVPVGSTTTHILPPAESPAVEGRHWGTLGRKNIPFHAVHEFPITVTLGEAIAIANAACGYESELPYPVSIATLREDALEFCRSVELARVKNNGHIRQEQLRTDKRRRDRVFYETRHKRLLRAHGIAKARRALLELNHADYALAVSYGAEFL